MDKDDLRNRFEYHPAVTDQARDEHQAIRSLCLDLALSIDGIVPDGREKSLALTHLEEVMFWANAALARRP